MTQAAPALLFVQADVDAEHAQRWNGWYTGRHVTDRAATPGFAHCARWESVSGAAGVGIGGALPRYLTTYDVQNADTLKSDAYQSLSRPPRLTDEDRTMLRLFRNTNRAVLERTLESIAENAVDWRSCGGLLAVGLVPDPAYDEEYNAWYDEEHIPYLIKVPGVLRARRFRAIEGEPGYLALYELESPEVRQSAPFQTAIDTPWSARMRRHCERKITGVFRRIPLLMR